MSYNQAFEPQLRTLHMLGSDLKSQQLLDIRQFPARSWGNLEYIWVSYNSLQHSPAYEALVSAITPDSWLWMHYEEGHCCEFANASKYTSFEVSLRSEVVDSDATIT